ncbi:zinc-dependent peptidase [Parasulfitobacter algicola]|uniref:Zinc-dependent peptidase n=1 Tax=Parasulfitobacter algicola TaxID=2614809 RepID=A0ABX2IUD4_9RHOB|nr:M90 family metallopeptidase [Sulfitobacter algicola]NSX56517.1 zinc-dependent peptidase [Sulfitobacter algicola]
MVIFLTLLFIITAAISARFWAKYRKRKKLLSTALLDHQRAIILEKVPIIQKIPPELRYTLEGKINVFLDQVDFYGCDGLDVTEEMELSIAAQACLLIMNSDAWYKHLRTNLIYPGAFKSQQASHSGYIITEHETVRLGESWSYGPVVLSWAHSEQGAINHEDGQNVVLHEFAHQIDQLSGHTDGAPILRKGQSFADWERVFVQAYKDHVQNIEKGRKTVLDAYGAAGQEEFFAVAVEVFFEKPARLKREEPEVYEQLSELFQLDPTAW